MMRAALKAGAKHLSCFGTEKLRHLYGHHGFEITESYPWNEELAPTDWDHELEDEPDYIIMKRAQAHVQKPLF